MPIVGQKQVEGILGRSVVEILPSLENMMAAPDFAEEEVREVSMEAWQSAAQQVLAGVSVRVGVPDTQFGRVAKSVVNGWEATQKAFEQVEFFLSATDLVSVGLLQTGLLSRATGYAAQAISAVPIIGQVAALGWALGQSLYRSALAQRKARDKDLPDPVQFDPEDDLWAYRHGLLAKLETSLDWGNIWSPPAYWPDMGLKSPATPVPPDERKRELFRGELVEGGGWSINPTHTNPDWLGAVPGTDFVHAAISPKANEPPRVIEVRPKAPKGLPKIVNMGSVRRPTCRHQTTWIWSHLESLGPSMFCIHAEDLAMRWHRYLYALRYYISVALMRDERLIGDPELRTAFGWSKPHRNGRPQNVDWPSAWGVDKATPVLACQRLKDRQIAALEVGIGAYVHPDAAALRDPKVREEYRIRRRMMLEMADNPEITLDIDLKSIPDFSFLADLTRRLQQRPDWGKPRVPIVTALDLPGVVPEVGVPESGPFGKPKAGLRLGAGKIVSTTSPTRPKRNDTAALAVVGAAAVVAAVAYGRR